MSLFANIPLAAPDPIVGTTAAFNNDTDPNKINLGVGAYRTEEGRPYVLNVVREAEEELLKELGSGNNKEYLPIDGPPKLKEYTRELVFGKGAAAIAEDRIASSQALSGTGALRVVAAFVKEQLPAASHEIWLSKPTWGNHTALFQRAGLRVREYPYWDAETRGLDVDGWLRALREEATPGALVLLHACAHNPTGVDPTEEQWKQVAAVMREKRLVPLLDSAYQGYASGDLDKDAWATRYFASQGFELFVCQSFAKNLGLYGERIGMIHVLCASAEQQRAVTSQLKVVIRPMYSSPPKHGALLVEKILGHPERYARWKSELRSMAERVLEVRALLQKALEDRKVPGTWTHITSQVGMFSFTGLKPDECGRLIEEHHVYLLKSGRISLAGLNKGNVEHFAQAVDEVIRFCNAGSASMVGSPERKKQKVA